MSTFLIGVGVFIAMLVAALIGVWLSYRPGYYSEQA